MTLCEKRAIREMEGEKEGKRQRKMERMRERRRERGTDRGGVLLKTSMVTLAFLRMQ